MDLREFMRTRFDRRHLIYPVGTGTSGLRALLHVRDIERLPVDEWPNRRVIDCAVREPDLIVLDVHTPRQVALDALAGAGAAEALVTRRGGVVGWVAAHDLADRSRDLSTDR